MAELVAFKSNWIHWKPQGRPGHEQLPVSVCLFGFGEGQSHDLHFVPSEQSIRPVHTSAFAAAEITLLDSGPCVATTH